MTERTTCLTQEEIAALLTSSDSDREEAADAHLAHCAHCRQALRAAMADTAEGFAHQLNSETDDLDCPENDALLRYAEGTADAFEAEMIALHVEDCLSCTSALAFAQQARRQTERAQTTAFAPLPALSTNAPNFAPNSNTQENAPLHDAPSPPVTATPLSWHLRLRQKFALAFSKPLVTFAAGAALACGFMYAVFMTQFHARTPDQLARKATPLPENQHSQEAQHNADTQRRLTLQIEALNAAMKQAQENARRSRAETQQLKQKLTHIRQEIAASKRQQQQSLFAGAVLVAETGKDDLVFQDKQGRLHHDQLLDTRVSNYLKHPQQAIADIQTALNSVRPPKLRTMDQEHPSLSPRQLLAPVACVVESPTPTFEWKPVTDAAYYKIRGLDKESGQAWTADERANVPHYTMPRPFARGHAYSWEVTAYKADNTEIPHSESALFKVMDAETADGLQRCKDDPLTRGALYIAAGMPAQATAEYKKFLQQHPRSPLAPRVQALLRSLQSTSKQTSSP